MQAAVKSHEELSAAWKLGNHELTQQLLHKLEVKLPVLLYRLSLMSILLALPHLPVDNRWT